MGIWNEIEARVIYAQNVSQAKQYAATGNAEVAFIPLSLVKPGEGSYLEVSEESHRPIDQALGIIKDSPKQAAARQFIEMDSPIKEITLSYLRQLSWVQRITYIPTLE